MIYSMLENEGSKSVANLHSEILDASSSWSNFLHFHIVFREIWSNNKYAPSPFGLAFPGSTLASHYRPQTKDKVIFSDVSRILFTGGGLVSQHALQVVSQHALQVSGWWYPSMPSRSPGPHPMGKFRGLA